jgi:nucleoside-diphosphate-sugar epimerase
VRLLESDVRSVSVNICSGHDISLKKIIQDANKIAGYDIEVRVNPDFVRANEIKQLHGDNAYLKQLIGDHPLIPFKDTLQWMYEAK